MRVGRRRTPAARIYAQAGRPAMRTPWQEAEWCAVDLELTGLDPAGDHVIAVGLTPISNGRVQLGDARYCLVASDRSSSPAALLTHRLRREELRSAPSLAVVMELILHTLAGRVPVFHHAVVEQRFLTPHLRRRGLGMPPAADTEQLGRIWLRRRGEAAPETLSLAALSAALGQRPEPAHHALGDAISTAQTFIALATLLGGDGQAQSVGSLLSASVRKAAGSGRAPTG